MPNLYNTVDLQSLQLSLPIPIRQDRLMQYVLALPDAQVIDAAQFPVVIQRFFEYKRKTVTPRSLFNYQFALEPFIQWWTHYPHIHSHQLSEEKVRLFFQWYEHEFRRPAGGATSNYMLNDTSKKLRHFLAWVHQHGGLSQNVSSICPVVKIKGGKKFYPTLEEIDTIFTSLATNKRATWVRDCAMIALAVSTGARRFEMGELLTEDIHFFDNPDIGDLNVRHNHQGWVHLRKVKGDAQGYGDGRYSVFDSITGVLIKLYLTISGKKKGRFLGLNHHGIASAVHDIAQESGVNKLHPHAFRSALVDHWTFVNGDKGRAADIALDLQIGHSLERTGANKHYIDTQNHNKVITRIRQFHVSPLTALLDDGKWDWKRFPVFVPD